MSINKRSDLKTESINKNSINIDSMSTYDILQTINNEDNFSNQDWKNLYNTQQKKRGA